MKEAIVIETMFQEVPFEQRFEKIRAAGYKYTELWNLNGKDPEAVRRLADQSGVSIIGLSGDIRPAGRSRHGGCFALRRVHRPGEGVHGLREDPGREISAYAFQRL